MCADFEIPMHYNNPSFSAIVRSTPMNQSTYRFATIHFMFLGTCDGRDHREEEGKDKKERKVFHDGLKKGMTRGWERKASNKLENSPFLYIERSKKGDILF